jgi:hypothetical protein
MYAGKSKYDGNVLIGQEYITPKGNIFIVVGETKRLYEVEVYAGPATGKGIDIPKEVFKTLVECGHYSEVEDK